MRAILVAEFYHELSAVLADTIEASGGLIRWEEGVPIKRADGWYQATIWLPRSSRISSSELRERAEKRIGLSFRQ